jgi:hypothetical protein
MFERIQNFPSSRIIRIGLSFIFFFVLIDLCVFLFLPSYKQTLRASEYFLDINVCNFSDKDLSEIDQMIKSDTKPKIFLLGDSVGYGIGLEEQESLSSSLRNTNKDYSVYNLSVCGAKPLDYYLWIQYLSEIDQGNSNTYLLQYNYKWFNLGKEKLENLISQKKILIYFQKYLTDEIKTDLNFNPNWFDNFKYSIESKIPVVSSKTHLFALLFKEKSKEDLIQHIFFGGKQKPSFEEKKKNFNCKIDYSSDEWGSNDFNYKIYLQTMDFISQNSLKAVVFLPPYNQESIKKCMDEKFKNNTEKFVNDAKGKNIKVFDFTSLLPPDLFLDDMHLTNQGIKEFSTEIYKEVQ